METWNGNYVPDGGDAWDIIGDLRKMALQNNRIIPVYAKAERDGLVVDAPGGQIPEGTVVLRLDQSAHGPVFDIYTGDAWVPGDTGWQDLTPRLKNGWTASTGSVPPAAKIRNGEVILRGQVANSTNPVGNSEVLTLPSGFPPASAGGSLYFPLGPRTSVSMAAVVEVDGKLIIWQQSESAAVRPLNAIRYGLS